MRLREKRGAVLRLADGERTGEPRVGRVVAFRGGEVFVEEGGSGPLVARVSAALDDGALEQAARAQQEALLVFENADPARPVLLALLRSRTPLVEDLLAPMPPPGPVARVDGKRVVIEGREEIVLRCGKSSLTLRSDGKVVLRGVTVVSQAEQVNKIRGGKVQLN